jgi:O-methyltransferase
MPPASRAVAEFGVFRGGSTRFIAEALRLRGLDLPLYACDTFDGHATVDEARDARHRTGKQFSGVDATRVRTYLEGLPSVRVLQGDIEQTAEQMAEEQGFGFVHIDVDVYPATRFCLEFFAPRLVPGGTIVVDDYGFKTCPGVKEAVDDFTAAHASFRLLHLTTGQAVLIRTG